MNDKNKARLKESLIVLLCAKVSAFLLFFPSLSKLGGKDNHFFAQIWETFFHSAPKETLLGDGADPVGSFWVNEI